MKLPACKPFAMHGFVPVKTHLSVVFGTGIYVMIHGSIWRNKNQHLMFCVSAIFTKGNSFDGMNPFKKKKNLLLS